MDYITRVTLDRAKKNNWLKTFENFTPGDTVNVHVRIKEGEKERVQVYKGVVIKIQGQGLGKSFTVRKMSSGIGVERTFPFSSPKLEKVEVVSRGKVRRSRLYFLRGLSGRAARLNAETASDNAAESTLAGTDGPVKATGKKAKAEKKAKVEEKPKS